MNMEMDMVEHEWTCMRIYAGDMHMDKLMNTDMEWTCGNPIGQLVQTSNNTSAKTLVNYRLPSFQCK